MVGGDACGKSRGRATAKELDRPGLPRRDGSGVSGSHAATVCAAHVDEAEALVRHPDRASGRSSVAYPRDHSKSALFCLHNAQRARRISRILLVLFFQRAAPALLEYALSARLRYGAAIVLLDVSSIVAVSLERLFPGARKAQLPAGGQGGPRPAFRALLDRCSDGVLYFLDNAGILFDAYLPGVGVVVGRSARGGRTRHWGLGSPWDACVVRRSRIGGGGGNYDSGICPKFTYARRYCGSIDGTSGRISGCHSATWRILRWPPSHIFDCRWR